MDWFSNLLVILQHVPSWSLYNSNFSICATEVSTPYFIYAKIIFIFNFYNSQSSGHYFSSGTIKGGFSLRIIMISVWLINIYISQTIIHQIFHRLISLHLFFYIISPLRNSTVFIQQYLSRLKELMTMFLFPVIQDYLSSLRSIFSLYLNQVIAIVCTNIFFSIFLNLQ